jgi:hypothetical protein
VASFSLLSASSLPEVDVGSGAAVLVPSISSRQQCIELKRYATNEL